MPKQSVLLGGRPVRRTGFGAMQLPGPGVFGPPKDRDIALAVLRRAIDAGVNHIDTAQFYGPDVANELLREALYPYPDELVIVSKVGAATRRSGSVAFGATARTTPSRSRSKSRIPGLGSNPRRQSASTSGIRRVAHRAAGRDGSTATGGPDRTHWIEQRRVGPVSDRPVSDRHRVRAESLQLG